MTSSRSLVSVLAELYDTKDKSRRIVEDAGLDPKYIEFKENAIDNWHNIVKEARLRGKVKDLIDVVCGEYSEKGPELRDLLQTSTPQTGPSATTSAKYVNLPQQGEQVPTFLSTKSGESTTAPSQSPLQPPPRKLVEPSQEFLKIGRDKHWDREEAANDFLRLITQEKTGNEKEDNQHVLVLQGREAGLDSLVDRFEEMCQKVTTKRPVLYTRVSLGSLYSDNYYSLALAIVGGLSRLANQKTLTDQETILVEAYKYIEEIEEKTGIQSQSADQFAKNLTEKYLARVASNCTVVLLLQGFDNMLRDSSTSKWLMEKWLTRHAWFVEGMVVLLTGEKGLNDLKGQQFVSHHDLPPLNKEKLREWATQSQDYGFNWFTDEEAKIAHEICNGNPEKFRKLLDYTNRLLKVDVA